MRDATPDPRRPGLRDAVYRGYVEHVRSRPVEMTFAPTVQMALLRIDGTDRPGGLPLDALAPVRFRRADYLGDAGQPLAECVRDTVEAALGRRPGGPVHMLAHVRLLGHCFNPLAVYYCFEDDRLDAVVCDVCNTPWGQRHPYVFDTGTPDFESPDFGSPDRGATGHEVDKALHVSPFLPMELTYRVDVPRPGEEIRLRVEAGDGNGPLLRTSLKLQRVEGPFGPRQLLRRPLSTYAVSAGIHRQALRLWRAGAPFHQHPRRRDEVAASPSVSPVTPPLRVPRFARAPARCLLLGLLDRGRGGSVTVRDVHRTATYGRGDLHVDVDVHDQETWRAVAGRGSIGIGASYFDGWWDTDDLPALVQILIRDIGPLDATRERARRLVAPVADPVRTRMANDRRRHWEDVRAHYDLGDDLFAQFLDDSLMYSAAIFPRADSTLEEASAFKLRRVVEQLDLQPCDRVLEIGTGWGGFAIHAATTTGCHVTTTTVSRRQFDAVRRKVEDLGLGDRITVLDRDYRELCGTFDKLVSIEMIEAVDWRDHDTYFGVCADRLRPGGQMLLQAILIADDRFERAKNTSEFIRQFIFPGGCLPSASSIVACLDRAGLRAEEWFETGPHYVRTLREWRRRFDAAGGELSRLGYDERFQRMWRFYLAYCEAAFTEGHVHGTQLRIGKPG